MITRFAATNLADRMAPRLLLIWAGLALGVAFLATPAKFLAPSLTLDVALDVGRHTFRVFNRTELLILPVLILLAAGSTERRRSLLRLSAPAVIVALQAMWLVPALDARVLVIQAGARAPPSHLHSIYVGAELVKVMWLLVAGLSARSAPTRRPKPFSRSVPMAASSVEQFP